MISSSTPQPSWSLCPHQLQKRDWIASVVVFILALTLYAFTVLPDIGGPEDTPKFQFLGYVLGTAHPPGYPLYVLLSHLFVKLPVGSIAYRANLFSGVLAAFAAAVAFLVCRQIGSSRWAAVFASLGLVTGANFWRGALFAEVYSLAAVVAVTAVSLLLGWGASADRRLLLASAAVASVGLGNHLTIIGIAPALVAYVLLRDRRVITPRLLLAILAILIIGVSQYGFIILRTRQAAKYLESGATSVSELVGIVTAERFAEQRFAFSPAVLFGYQVPTVSSYIGADLTPLGVAAMVLGIVMALLRRNLSAALVMCAAAGTFAMVVNLSGDVSGFIVPVVVLIWPLAALGLDAFHSAVRTQSFVRLMALLAGIIGVALGAAIPIRNLLTNYKAVDQSGQTADAEFVRAAYQQLPDRAAVVADGYGRAMTLQYLAVTRESGRSSNLKSIPYGGDAVREAIREGRRVFAFDTAARYLSTEGLHFERSPVSGALVDDWLRRLPRGTVIVASSANSPLPRELVGDDLWRSGSVGRQRAHSAFARVVGTSAAAWQQDGATASLTVDEATLKHALPPFAGPVTATADNRGAWIEIGGRRISDTTLGTSVVMFTPDGRLGFAFEVPPGTALRVPFPPRLYEVKGENVCVEVGTDKWSDVTRVLESGSWVTTLFATGGSVTVDMWFPESSRVRARGLDMLGLSFAHAVGATEHPEGGYTLGLELRRLRGYRAAFRVAFGGITGPARAKLRSGGSQPSVTLCGYAQLPLFTSSSDSALLRPDFDSEAYFGVGWGPPAQTDTGPVRGAEDFAVLQLPLSPTHDYSMVLNLVAEGDVSVGMTVNGVPVSTCAVGPASHCEIKIPSGLLQDGVASLTLSSPAPVPFVPNKKLLTFRGAHIARYPRGAPAMLK